MQWRVERGLCRNRTAEGVLTDTPDFTYLDGRPTPLLVKLIFKIQLTNLFTGQHLLCLRQISLYGLSNKLHISHGSPWICTSLNAWPVATTLLNVFSNVDSIRYTKLNLLMYCHI